MNKLLYLNKLNWPLRLPIKWALWGLTVLLVCFPYPTRLVRHVEHWRNPNALIEPDAPALQPLLKEVRAELANKDAVLQPPEVMNFVQQYVYKKIKYEWDWNTWGMADYLPTVTEAIKMGKEDCDGRAVVAASLLSNLGFKTQLVTDLAHVWVKTDHGETMGPGQKKTLIATDRGLKLQLSGLLQTPKAVAFGIAVFPLLRELIIVGAAWFLLLRSGGRIGFNLGGLLLLLGGLIVIRWASGDFRQPVMWMQGVAVACLATGVTALWFSGRSGRRSAGIATNDD